MERATPEQIALFLPLKRSVAAGSSVALRYRRVSEAAWRVAHPLLRIHPEWTEGSAPVPPVDSFAGAIFDLTSGSTYELEITLIEPGRGNQTMTLSAVTRSLAPAAPAVTQRAVPGDNLQTKLSALAAGDVLELDNGAYNVSGLTLSRSGTAARPIYVRGKSRSGVVLRNANQVLQLQNASHVVIENMTLEGSGVDSGTNASSGGIVFWSGAVQQNLTLRDLDIRGVDTGIVAFGATRDLTIYNCDLRGNNQWTASFLNSNLTWNDDGIRVPGEGNVVFENTLHAFGDSFAVIDGVFSSGVYFYRNLVTMTGDDAFEADYATRNIGFYDNYIENSATFLSLDPLWGGPLYCFRNVSVNSFRGPFKFNNVNSGFVVYSNTIVRTEGTTGWGWVQFNDGELQNWSFRNNLLIYRGTSNQLLAVESGGNDVIDFSNNGWFPDGSVRWTNSGGSFSSIATARTSLPPTTPVFGTSATRHLNDVITVSDPFVTPITLGANHLSAVTAVIAPKVRAGTSVKNAGVAIPNITDGHTGTAPDIGAEIEGRSPVRWGALR